MRLSFCTASFACLLVSTGCGGEGLVTTKTTSPDMTLDGMSTTTGALCGTAPHAVATVVGTPDSLMISGASIFWVTQTEGSNGTLWKSTRDADGALPFTIAAGLLGIDGNHVVWSVGNERHLYESDITALNATDLGISLSDYAGSHGPLRPLVANDRVTWSDDKIGGGAFYRMPLTGGTPMQRQLAASSVSVVDWSDLGDSMIWANDTGLWRGDGTGTGTLIGQPGAAILRVSASTAYLYGPAGVLAVPLAGGPTRIITGPLGEIVDTESCSGMLGKQGRDRIVVAPDESVYFTTWSDCLDGSFDHTIWRAGASQRKLARYRQQGFAEDGLLSVDDQCLYWLSADTANATSSLWSLASNAATK